MFNVSEFRSYIDRDDVLRNNRFRMQFTIPMGMINNGGETQNNSRIIRELEFWADQASIPAIGLTTHTAYRYGYGVFEKRPYSAIFNDFMVSFIVDGYNEKWKLFKDWQKMIFNHDMSNGINGPSGTVGLGFLGQGGTLATQPYELAYRDEYITDISIQVFNQIGDMVTEVTMREAYPVQVSPLDFNWADNNTINRLNVAFTYTDIY